MRACVRPDEKEALVLHNFCTAPGREYLGNKLIHRLLTGEGAVGAASAAVLIDFR